MKKLYTTFYHPSGARVDVHQSGSKYELATTLPDGKVCNHRSFIGKKAMSPYLALLVSSGYSERQPS